MNLLIGNDPSPLPSKNTSAMANERTPKSPIKEITEVESSLPRSDTNEASGSSEEADKGADMSQNIAAGSLDLYTPQLAAGLGSNNVTAQVLGILEEFTVFQKLPIELRTRIWDHALPGPRVVEVCWGRHGLYSDCAPPAMLHVCHESRLRALKIFKVMSCGDPASRYQKRASFHTYINPKEDLVYYSFRSPSQCALQTSPWASVGDALCFTDPLVQHVAIGQKIWGNSWLYDWGCLLQRAETLKTIAVVYSDVCVPEYGGVGVRRPAIGFTNCDSSEIKDIFRWNDFGQEVVKTSFDDSEQLYLDRQFRKFKDELIDALVDGEVDGIEEEDVETLECIGIDITRSEVGEQSVELMKPPKMMVGIDGRNLFIMPGLDGDD